MSETTERATASEQITTNKKRKLVTFSTEVEVRLIDRVVDPEIKKTLYYTAEDIWIFENKLQVTIALGSLIKSSKELQCKMNEDQVYLDQHLEHQEYVESAGRLDWRSKNNDDDCRNGGIDRMTL